MIHVNAKPLSILVLTPRQFTYHFTYYSHCELLLKSIIYAHVYKKRLIPHFTSDMSVFSALSTIVLALRDVITPWLSGTICY